MNLYLWGAILGTAFCGLVLSYWIHGLEGRIKSLEYNLRVAIDMAKDRDE